MKGFVSKKIERLLSGIIESEKNTLYTVTMYQPQKPEKLRKLNDKEDK